MKIGYARVSTTEQKLDTQLEALKAFGCERVFSETISSRVKSRPELTRLLEHLRSGDQLVIYKLDRVARSTIELLHFLEHLSEKDIAIKSLGETWVDTTTSAGKAMITVFAGFAEFERDLIRQRTSDGREAAKSRGVKFGRPRKLSLEQIGVIVNAHRNGASVKQIAQSFSVGRDTIYRALRGR
jgi:DNA invertase Pin-like site-specific DNA recombinase